ncbi:MAG: peroxiredoxin [Omnitrophica WOR_2 bacterium]
MGTQRYVRLEELEQRFSQLEPKLKDSPEKEAISILHAMIHDSRRQPVSNISEASRNVVQTTLEDVANLYKTAPKMEGKAENQGLQVGSKAPDFTLQDAGGKQVSLHDFRGQPVVLVFYPLDWSPACSDQLSLYQSELKELQEYHSQILAVSVDSIYSHGAWAAVRGIEFPLLSDFNPKGDVARKYQVWRETDGFSERALFVVDREGVIRYRTVSPQLHMIPDIYELFENLKEMTGQPASATSN